MLSCIGACNDSPFSAHLGVSSAEDRLGTADQEPVSEVGAIYFLALEAEHLSVRRFPLVFDPGFLAVR